MKSAKRFLAFLLTMATLLGLLPAHALAQEGEGRYSDTAGHWAQAAIERWSGYGVVAGGGDGAFYPDRSITRGEMAKIIATVLHLSTIGENIFEDLSEDAWYSEPVLKCYAAGIMTGDGAGHIFPETPITRQEACKMLAEAFGIAPLAEVAGEGFADDADIDSWAAPYVAALHAAGYIRGVGDNLFAPKQSITRASVVTILDNVIAGYITEPGDYSGTYDGIVVVICNGVTFEDSVINGNLIVVEGTEQGAVILSETTVAGEILAPEGAVIVKQQTDDSPLPVPTQQKDIILAQAGRAAAPIWIDSDYAEDDGIYMIAEAVADDIELLTGSRPDVVQSKPQDNVVIIAGTLDDQVIKDLGLNWNITQEDWERYQIRVSVKNGQTRIIVAGSDKRGVIYGLFHLSQDLGGVSPWIYWGDVAPEQKEVLSFTKEELETTSQTPSVKYRGIFLNDEAPSLTGWASATFDSLYPLQRGNKGFNHYFYERVFELILRLKGNYLWPAMWNSSFNTDDPLNAYLANQYGVVMGTSHHEHMSAADKEWNWLGAGQYGGSGAWNFATNADELVKFWTNAMEDRKDYERVVTIGMRGQNDTSMLPAGSTVEENVALLEQIVAAQRGIIEEVHGSADAVPQVWALYKEVEDYYYGGMEVPEDVILLLCDDNFANVRTLPTEEMRQTHTGGFGMYYHFDYHGGPRSYEWINQTPITKIWEQMTTAYDAGVDQLWVVNVGDLKPMELPIDYFLNLAYDYDTWSEIGKTDDFTVQWAQKQFGATYAEEIADILDTYTWMNGQLKSEVIFPTSYSLTNFEEADRILSRFIASVERAEEIYDLMPVDKKDAYWQLVLFPARASMNVMRMNVYAGKSQLYGSLGLTIANTYAELAQEAFRQDRADVAHYNDTLADGKWTNMMGSAHIGYTAWNGPNSDVLSSDEGRAPKGTTVTPSTGSEMAVMIQGAATLAGATGTSVPAFSNTAQEVRFVDIFNKKEDAFAFTANADMPWLIVSQTAGTVSQQVRLALEIDWSRLKEPVNNCTLTIEGAGQTVVLNITARVVDLDLAQHTFVETTGMVSINPATWAGNVSGDGITWSVIEGYGRSGTAVKPLPNTRHVIDETDRPYMEYKVQINTPGTYNMNVYIAPTNNHTNSTAAEGIASNEQLRFAWSVDGSEPGVVSSLPAGFIVSQGSWETGVWYNGRTIAIRLGTLEAGEHTLRIYAVDPAVVIQQLVLFTGLLPTSHLPAPETYYVGSEVVGQRASYLAVITDEQAREDRIVTFDAGLGKFEGDAQVSTLTAYAAQGNRIQAERLATLNPVREGYLFIGWATAQGNTVTDLTVFNEDTTVYARYESSARVAILYKGNFAGAPEDITDSSPKEASYALKMGTIFQNTEDIYQEFVGWNSAADGSGTSYAPGEVVSFAVDAADTFTLYAIWRTRSYNVTFNTKGAGEVAAQNGVSRVTPPDALTKEPFIFSHWSLSDGGAAYDLATPLSRDITLYAVWEAPEWWDAYRLTKTVGETTYDTIDFDGVSHGNNFYGGLLTQWQNSAGYTVENTNPDVYDTTRQSSLKITNFASGPNFNFRANAASPACGAYDQLTAGDVGTSWVYLSLDVYFYGTPTGSFTLRSPDAGGQEGLVIPASQLVGDAWNRIEGYVQVPVNLASGGQNYARLRFYATTGTTAIHLTNIRAWLTDSNGGLDVQTYTVTFECNGGTGIAPIENVSAGSKITAPADPRRNNFLFGGWYKEAALTNAWDFDSDEVGADITLYAKWTAGTTYTVTFAANGGSETAPIEGLVAGSRITAPADPTRSGYTFGGWYKETGLTTPWDFGNDAVNANTTLYAKWTGETYDVTFHAKGGSAVSTQTGVTTATEPSDPVKAPFVFSHWSLSDGGAAYDFGTVLTEDITLYAVWEAPVWWAEHALFPASHPTVSPLNFAEGLDYGGMVGGEVQSGTAPKVAYQTGDPAGLDLAGSHATSLKLIAANGCRGLSIRFRDSGGSNMMVDAEGGSFAVFSASGDSKYVYVIMDLYNPSASNLGIRLYSYTGSSNNGSATQFTASNGVFGAGTAVVNLTPGWNRLEGYVLLPSDNSGNTENHIQIRPHAGGTNFVSDFYLTNLQIWYAGENGGLNAQP